MFFGPDGSMMSAKWLNIKVWLQYAEGFDKTQHRLPLGMLRPFVLGQHSRN